MQPVSVKYLRALLPLCLLLWGCGNNQSLSEQEAKTIALQGAGIEESNVRSMSVESGTLDGEETYIIQFETDTRTYQTILSRSDGEVLRSSYQSKDVPALDGSEGSSGTNPSGDDGTAPADPAFITLEEAKMIAVQDAGVSVNDVTFTKVKNDGSSAYPIYDIEFRSSSTHYEYEIGADGTIYQLEQETYGYQSGSGSEITLSQARDLALSKVDGATGNNIHIEEEWDDGMHLYEGEIYYNNTKYEFEIDASSGSFLKWSMDYRD